MSKVSTEKNKKKQTKKEREKMYLMYYLNEDGKRVYTLKVRRDYYYRAFVCFFLRSLGETCGIVCCDLARARVVGPEEDFVGFFFGLEFFDIILSLS